MRFCRDTPFHLVPDRAAFVPLSMLDLLDTPVGRIPDAGQLEARLRSAFQQFSLRQIAHREFECLLADVDIAVWQHLQATVRPHTLAYADLCCLLAYYGIDYLENLCRLFQSFRLVLWEPERYLWLYAEKTQCADLGYLPEHLLLLYTKYHDPGLLGILLELHLQDGEDKERYLDMIAVLWDENPAAILYSTSQDQQRLCNVLCALTRVALTLNDPEVWKTYYRTLQRAVHLREWSVMRVALRMMTVLKRVQKYAD
jgi:hypothetical protein